MMQAYRNNSAVAIEAKYVFPLEDMAAVCGFEAFINGKHIVGQVCVCVCVCVCCVRPCVSACVRVYNVHVYVCKLYVYR